MTIVSHVIPIDEKVSPSENEEKDKEPEDEAICNAPDQ